MGYHFLQRDDVHGKEGKKEKMAKEKKPSPKGGLVVSDSGNRVFRFAGLETECVGRKALELPRRMCMCVCVCEAESWQLLW